MILYKPSLRLRRLIIKKGSQTAYDEVFHDGVNIIRGENESGKTTIIEAIIYILGGSIPKKKVEFNHCDVIYGEFVINDNFYTLKRNIGADGENPPIEFYSGKYEEGITQESEWFKYPHRRSDTKKSFSMMLFSLLGIPEEESEESNITIHDILRLLYYDQKTSSEKIFLSQDYPEQGIKKQAVSDLILGIDDYEILKLKQKLSKKEKEYNILNGEYKQIFDILGTANLEANSQKLEEELKEYREEIEQINNKLDLILNDKINNSQDESVGIKQNIIKLQKDLSMKIDNCFSLKYEIEDFDNFLNSINNRLEALKNAQEVASICKLEFEFCPQCLQKIDINVESNTTCSLCRNEIKKDGIKQNYIKMWNELFFQKQETENIIKNKKIEINNLKLSISKNESILTAEKQKYKNYVESCSLKEAMVKNHYTRLGYLEKSILDVHEKQKLAKRIDEIETEKVKLYANIGEIKAKIDNIATTLQAKKDIIYTKIDELAMKLIRNDTSQDLKMVSSLRFDFSKDELFAVGKGSLAASTSTYVKNSFFFALFLTSLSLDFVRYPRFVILDNLEDSGLQTPRLQQFHNDIIECSNESDVTHQIIFSARSEVLTKELNESDLCVGKEYKNEIGKYSLNFS